MPLLFRLMKIDGSKPKIGSAFMCLGARVPQDIRPDASGMVAPGNGGMSVGAGPIDMRPAMTPMCYEKIVPGAASQSRNVWIWRMGAGDFVANQVANRLVLRIDPEDNKHGLVEPDGSMPLGDYQNELGATQNAWSVVPP